MNNYAQMDELPFLEAGELKLYPFAGDKLMTVRAELPKGSIAAKHSHPHEQMSFVAKGHIKVRMKGKEFALLQGGIVHFPSNEEHEVEAVEDTTLIDFFTPLREDLLQKLKQVSG
ncbi:cupin domain-containing protein [Muricauda sp. 334s03]|jgi:quercetin dioxygenase-like cupin family protein|uniref:Cupin domain-containing protein n=1 Tax=Flagellimonas yonaguniensis TaxID=3031325 RepID=A0ABT5Y494_9FLAO|nr:MULTISPECIES: cupin domain-containing protein [Allomuricauda]MDF0718168.1 cupin domain-containing protein [[Muricauda] yonaguniensis]|tara:strand:+ start:2118 stop:2462 length:345 start_codon:yes stop_codon:yes gene_type:complete